jgi:ubiquinone/menaquinone biosynthesis C-methylase UbiE
MNKQSKLDNGNGNAPDSRVSGAGDVMSQYHTSRHLRARGDLHSRYATRSWFDWVARHLEVPTHGRVLDVGCGAGWFWFASTPYVPDCIRLELVDISPGMVAEAEKNLSALGYFRAFKGSTADVLELPFAAETFDAVVAMHMLYHVGNIPGALAEMARVLKPGGMTIATTNGTDNLRELFELSSVAFGGGTRDPAAKIFGADSARRMFPDHFNKVLINLYQDRYVISDGEDIVRYLCSFPPGSEADEARIDHLRVLTREKLEKEGGAINVLREGMLILGRKPAR